MRKKFLAQSAAVQFTIEYLPNATAIFERRNVDDFEICGLIFAQKILLQARLKMRISSEFKF